jgi:hypothetical protein
VIRFIPLEAVRKLTAVERGRLRGAGQEGVFGKC